MRIPQFDSFHTAHSRMRFVSHWKRSEAHYSVLLWVALFCLKPFPRPIFIINIRSSRVPLKCHLNVAQVEPQPFRVNRQQDNGRTQIVRCGMLR